MKKILLLILALVATSAVAMAQDSWTVAGSNAILNGTASWAPGNTENDMTSTDGVNYTLTVTGKTLEANTNYEYKVVKNHSWDEAYPSSNATLTVTETAVYTIVFSFNADTKAVNAVATKTGDAGEVTHTYSLAGSNELIFGSYWNETSTLTDMTLDETGFYTWTSDAVEVSASTFEFKVVQDHSWSVSFDQQSFTVKEKGVYTFQFMFDPETKDVYVFANKVNPSTVDYYMKHPWGGGDWTWKPLVKDNNSGLYYVKAQYGGNGVNVNDDSTDEGSTWVGTPEIEGNPQVGDDCVFYYNPTTGVVLIQKGVVTAINDLTVGSSKTYKTIENGQVVIVKDNVRYNIMGVKL